MVLAGNEVWAWVWKIVSERDGQERAKKGGDIGKGGKNFEDMWVQ